MGYYFTMENANTLSHLINGDVKKIYKGLLEDVDQRIKFKMLMRDIEYNLVSSDPIEYRLLCQKIITRLEENDNESLIGRKKNRYERLNEKNIDELSLIYSIKELSKKLGYFKYKFLVINKQSREKNEFEEIVYDYNYNFSSLFINPVDIDESNVYLLDSFIHIDKAVRAIEKWPILVVWSNLKKSYTIELNKNRTLRSILELINFEGEKCLSQLERESIQHPINYVFHLSDLHIGSKNNWYKLDRLKSIYKRKIKELEDDAHIHFVITGDSVDSPKKNYIKSFESLIQDITNNTPTVVFGNHDIDFFGNTLTTVRKKIYNNCISIIGSSIVELPNKILLIPVNSNTDKRFARGFVGEKQLSYLGTQLDLIEGEYKKITLLHHHVSSIPIPEWKKIGIFERIFKGIGESTLKLLDSDSFIEWNQSKGVDMILHGHKHIPYIDLKSIDDIPIVSCGSSTGKVNHIDEGKTYLNYNLLKITNNVCVITQYVEEILGGETKAMKTKIVNLQV